jgi:2-oxoglutarate ferredoxin oxidoreductase subunit beta
MSEMPVYKKKDFTSNQDVKWCPGCGDYSILASMQLAMTKLGRKKEDVAFISGIGCSSRFPYYMDTYGMHTIHGRALTFATGLKVHNEDLSVWVITGDGDGLSIGGNHTIHAVRRNVDLNVILFNNEIYGLTKGQYSPTSLPGTVAKSTPYGSLDNPFNPMQLILGAGSTFYARTIDTDPKHMQETFLAASKHKGLSFVEVFQNCVIFNDKVHDKETNRLTRDDHTIRLEDGKPLIFGKEKNKGIIQDGFNLKVVTIGEDGVTEADLVVHDVKDSNLAYLLSQLAVHTGAPVPIGVLRSVEAPVYDRQVNQQVADVKEKAKKRSVQELLESSNTWEVK